MRAARKPVVSGRIVMRDHIDEVDSDLEDIVMPAVRESITLKRGLTGVKPERVCMWGFEVMGAEQGDLLDDLFPGTGAVTDAWERWNQQSDIGGAI